MGILFFSFNTILVRLKGNFFTHYPSPYKCFNTILVRLKVSPKQNTHRGRVTFQYHTGSIKSELTDEENQARDLGFNTILVRLKDDPGQLWN